LRRVLHVGSRECRFERSRHLVTDGGDNDAVGHAAVDGMGRDEEPLPCLDAPSHRHDLHVERLDGDLRGLDELVGRLKGIHHRRQSQIEHTFESQHMQAHGNNNIKNGNLANSLSADDQLLSASALMMYEARRI
jgi:hypothetical protein